jgi:hypothetical protein
VIAATVAVMAAATGIAARGGIAGTVDHAEIGTIAGRAEIAGLIVNATAGMTKDRPLSSLRRF